MRQVLQCRPLAWAVTDQPREELDVLETMCDYGAGGDDDYGDFIREDSEEVAAGHPAPRESSLRGEIWKTVELIRIVDRLRSEILVLVRHMVAG